MVAAAWEALGNIRFEKFAQCSRCWAPQALCHSWEDVSGSGQPRFRPREGRQCRYQGVLRQIAAAILGLYGEVVGNWINEH